MTATTPTTIQGVSILSGQKHRSDHDVFTIVLSTDGIEVRRPGRAVQLMSWDRVSEWEIEECKGYVLLTLRGQGATTPLVVPGWTLDDLVVLMRDVTSDYSTDEPVWSVPVVEDRSDGQMTAAEEAVATAALAPGVPAPTSDAPTPVASAPHERAPDTETRPAQPARSEQRQRATRGTWMRRLSWKVPVTIVLLGVFVTAVIVVLLQSAGIIDWSFLGPVA